MTGTAGRVSASGSRCRARSTAPSATSSHPAHSTSAQPRTCPTPARHRGPSRPRRRRTSGRRGSTAPRRTRASSTRDPAPTAAPDRRADERRQPGERLHADDGLTARRRRRGPVVHQRRAVGGTRRQPKTPFARACSTHASCCSAVTLKQDSTVVVELDEEQPATRRPGRAPRRSRPGPGEEIGVGGRPIVRVGVVRAGVGPVLRGGRDRRPVQRVVDGGVELQLHRDARAGCRSTLDTLGMSVTMRLPLDQRGDDRRLVRRDARALRRRR